MLYDPDYDSAAATAAATNGGIATKPSEASMMTIHPTVKAECKASSHEMTMDLKRSSITANSLQVEPVFKKPRNLDIERIEGDDKNTPVGCSGRGDRGGAVADATVDEVRHHEISPSSVVQSPLPFQTTPDSIAVPMQRSASAPDCMDSSKQFQQQYNSQRIFAGLISQTAAAAAATNNGAGESGGCHTSTFPSHKSAEHLLPYVNHHREQVQNYRNANLQQQHQQPNFVNGYHPQQQQQQQQQQQPQNHQQFQRNQSFNQMDQFMSIPQPFNCQTSSPHQNAQFGDSNGTTNNPQFFNGGTSFGGGQGNSNFDPNQNQHHSNCGPYPNMLNNNPFRRFGDNTGLQSFLHSGNNGNGNNNTYNNVGMMMSMSNSVVANNFQQTGGGGGNGGNGMMMVRRDGTRYGDMPLFLPVLLAAPQDAVKVSSIQVLLRQQIEAFQATEDDVSTHTRGRNKPVSLRQVGIRCRHCAHLPVMRRQKGSTYFPASTLGLYQAAQNMSTTHIQCGLCPEMPLALKAQFTTLLAAKGASSGAGRPYWAESAKQMGLVDTEEGMYFVRELPPGAQIIHDMSARLQRKVTKPSAD